jgi:hypothetical protein
MTDHIPTTDCMNGNCRVCNFAAGIGRRESVHGELMTLEQAEAAWEESWKRWNDKGEAA